MILDTALSLSNIAKLKVYLRSSCNLSMYSESLLLPPDWSPEGDGRSSVVFAESIKSSLNDQAPDDLWDTMPWYIYIGQ